MFAFSILNNQNNFVRFRNRNVFQHKFDRFMLISCVRIDNNRFELTYLLDYTYCLNETKSLIPIKVIISYDDYIKISKIKFGVWLRFNNNYFGQNYLYIYRNLASNRLIFKTTRNDNYLTYGATNQYNHQLVFKGTLVDNAILEHLG